MNMYRILSEIGTGTLSPGNDYWMIPIDVAAEIFGEDEPFSLDDLEDLGAFKATLNNGETYYFILKTTTIPDDLYDFLLEFNAIIEFSYIFSDQNVGG